MACCEAPATNEVLYCTKNALPGFQVTLLQDFHSVADTFSALTQANQDASSYKAGVQTYMCQAGFCDLAAFEAEQAEALAYFKRQFALPVDATLVPIDGVPASNMESQVLGFLGLPLWRVVSTIEDVEVTIGFYRPTVTCSGVQVVCQAGPDDQVFTKAAVLLHELYFTASILPRVQEQVQVQDIPEPPVFPRGQVRASPQSAIQLQWDIGGPAKFDLPLEVYGRIMLYSECGKRQAEVRVRSEFAVIPTYSFGYDAQGNPDGITTTNENGNSGGTRLSAASRDLSNGQWIGFVSWGFNTTSIFKNLIAPPFTVQTPIDFSQTKMFNICFPPSLTKCAKIYPCPCVQESGR